MTPSDKDLWNELAAKAQGGDKRAYNALLKDIAGFTRNYLVSRLASPDWADDITQDVLISVHKSLPTYSPDRPFGPWLISIIHFRRTDYLRRHYNRKKIQESLENADLSRAPVTEPAHAGEYKDIEKALASLPEKQRKIVQMMKIQGYTAEETAGIMRMGVSAVKVSAHRALAKMKEGLR